MKKLAQGDKAPDFSAADQEGNVVSLASLRGRRVILYFYPKDSTPGCTAEACSLRDGKRELLRMGFEIVGVNPGSAASHRNFIEKNALNFPILVDADHAIADAYGVWGEKKMAGRAYMGILRTTFIIDAEGAIERIFDKVDVKRHFEQIADAYKQQ
ncbi:MAG: thioredoxin-dependent thiol peroxidase [Rikenellaceae bacterium]|jgi:peroxiredoxin Q/BCP|nr:thioredoxin-dependent thiol peroxidase [Rikenellaceae bacterium]